MDMKKISCVAVALMVLSVGSFVALGPSDSKAVADDAPILAAERDGLYAIVYEHQDGGAVVM